MSSNEESVRVAPEDLGPADSHFNSSHDARLATTLREVSSNVCGMKVSARGPHQASILKSDIVTGQ